ncbi:MAG TPA: sulfite exporter TauE/SafE family protein [Anaerolineales bacterium]|nr:sulfite exporter TauE/SafE family protein [Anaerolineales bacterium]
MNADPFALAIVAGVAFLVGFTKGGFGGLGGLLTPILAIIMLPAEATGVLLPMLIFGDWFAVYTYRGEWDMRVFWSMLPAAAVGSVIGTWLLTAVSPNALRLILAGFIMLLVAYKFASDRLQSWRYVPAPWHGPVVGGLAGLFSGLFNNGGPPFNAYLLLQKLKPRQFIATSAIFFAVLNLVKIPFFFFAGILNWALMRDLVWALLLVPLGIFAARRVVLRLDPQRFEGVIIALLFLSSAILIWQTL